MLIDGYSCWLLDILETELIPKKGGFVTGSCAKMKGVSSGLLFTGMFDTFQICIYVHCTCRFYMFSFYVWGILLGRAFFCAAHGGRQRVDWVLSMKRGKGVVNVSTTAATAAPTATTTTTTATTTTTTAATTTLTATAITSTTATCGLVGFLVVVYFDPFVAGLFHPVYALNNDLFFHCSLGR